MSGYADAADLMRASVVAGARRDGRPAHAQGGGRTSGLDRRLSGQPSPRRVGCRGAGRRTWRGSATQCQVRLNRTSRTDSLPPEARARAQEILNRRSIDDPAGSLHFLASPRITGVGLFPVQFVQTPTQLIVLYEYLWLFRVIPIDGRGHPDDMEPSTWATPSAEWEGDTLVVDVAGFKPGGWLTGGFVTSDALHLIERYTRVDRDQLDYEVTIDDPKVLTKPFTQRMTLMLREGRACASTSCAENNLDPAVYEKMLKDPAAASSFIRSTDKK